PCKKEGRVSASPDLPPRASPNLPLTHKRLCWLSHLPDLWKASSRSFLARKKETSGERTKGHRNPVGSRRLNASITPSHAERRSTLLEWPRSARRSRSERAVMLANSLSTSRSFSKSRLVWRALSES